MRLGRDGVWWEKGNTESEVGEGWSMVGERCNEYDTTKDSTRLRPAGTVELDQTLSFYTLGHTHGIHTQSPDIT